MIVIGVDPGKKGGLCFMRRGEGILDALRMQMHGRDISYDALIGFIRKVECELQKPRCEDMLVVIEKVHSMPAQGSKSTFTFGEGYGRLKGVCEALRVPFQLVTPQAWKKEVLQGTDKSKEAAIEWVKMRYPAVDLARGGRVDSDGIADAVCIAEYGIRKLV